MASIKDALEETLQDSYAWIKYILYTIPLFLIVSSIIGGKTLPGIVVISILSAILYFGFMLTCTYNVRNGKNFVLPSFNVFGVLWLGLKGCIALAPLGIIGYFTYVLIIQLLSKVFPEGIFFIIFKFVVIAVCASFALTGYLLYVKKFKILDAYNVKLILTHCMDVMLAVLFMFLLIAIVDVIIVVPLTYVLWLFMGIPNPVAIFIWSSIALLNIAMMGHYLAQVDYEIIPYNNDEESDILNRTVK